MSDLLHPLALLGFQGCTRPWRSAQVLAHVNRLAHWYEPLSQNKKAPESGLEKNTILYKSRYIDGAQEGTRTPTKLLAST